MSAEQNPKRRWYRFSLRTMLVVMVLSSAAFGYWVHWSREWIKQRNAMQQTLSSEVIFRPGVQVRAPAGLWLFGETGQSHIIVMVKGKESLARRLFPEADVEVSGHHEP